MQLLRQAACDVLPERRSEPCAQLMTVTLRDLNDDAGRRKASAVEVEQRFQRVFRTHGCKEVKRAHEVCMAAEAAVRKLEAAD